MGIIDRLKRHASQPAISADAFANDWNGICDNASTAVPSATAIQFGEGVNSWLYESEAALSPPVFDVRLFRQLSAFSPTVRKNVTDFLPLVADIWPIPPGVAPDEDGTAVLYWASDEMSVEIDIGDHGVDFGYFSSGDDGIGIADYESICSEARKSLSRMKLARIAWQSQQVMK